MTDKILPSKAVKALCGDVSDMTLWRWDKYLGFPKPIIISRRKYWYEKDILEFMARQSHGKGRKPGRDLRDGAQGEAVA